MSMIKYIGMDVHRATIVIAVLDANGKLTMESIIQTEATTVLGFIHGLKGELHVTFEEGTSAAWLYGLLVGQVARVVVCDPRRNALLKSGNKNDRIDARKLAELLRAGLLSPVYHGESRGQTLKELARSYRALTQDTTRVMNRLKAVYRSRAIACAGQKVYSPRYRQQWLEQLAEVGIRCRAERLYEQLDSLQKLRRQARKDLVSESQKCAAASRLREIPFLGRIRVAVLIAIVETPHRFRTKRQFWSYSGLALETRTSAEYGVVDGQLQRTQKLRGMRGLNPNHNHELKHIFKSAATEASLRSGPWKDWFTTKVAEGMRPTMARLTLARKLAAITLTLWKKGESYDEQRLKLQAV